MKKLIFCLLGIIFCSQVKAATLNAFASPSSTCYPGNGFISADVDGSVFGYTFYWFRGVVVTGEPDFTGHLIEFLEEGLYTVVATNNETDETLGPVTVMIEFIGESFDLSVNAIRDAGPCADTVYMASVDPISSSSYSFEWYKGIIAYAYPMVSSTAAAYNLPPGYYTVVATDDESQCVQIVTFRVEDMDFEDFELTVETVDRTSCSSANGRLVAAVNGVSDFPFVFDWYEGETTGGIPFSSEFMVEDLEAGIYTLEVKNAGGGCHATSSFTVMDLRDLPDATLIFELGAFSVPLVAGNTYAWTLDGEPLPNITNSFTPEAPGVYQAEVTTPEGCSSVSEEFVISALEPQLSRAQYAYPNPVRDELIIKGELPKGNYQISDITGQLIFSGPVSPQSSSTINTSTLAPGLYYLFINSQGGILRRSFIKE